MRPFTEIINFQSLTRHKQGKKGKNNLSSFSMNVTGSVNEEGGVQDGEVVVQQAELVHLSHFILKKNNFENAK